MKNAEVPNAMAKYFKNKDAQKVIRASRVEYMTEHKCEAENCIVDGTEPKDFCSVCKQRHEFYLSLSRLQHANSGILRSVRAAVKNIETK